MSGRLFAQASDQTSNAGLCRNVTYTDDIPCRWCMYKEYYSQGFLLWKHHSVQLRSTHTPSVSPAALQRLEAF